MASKPLNLPDRFEDLPSEDQRQVLTSGYEMTKLAYRHAAAICIAPPPSVGGEISNGSGFIVDLQGTFYLGTAWHVVESWLRRTEQGEKLLFQVGDALLTPGDGLAWKDEENDLVFIRLTQEEVRAIGASVCETVLGWPPPHPTEGSYVLVAGYPRTIRAEPGPGEVQFNCLSSLLEVTVVRDNYAVCQFRRENWVTFSPQGIPTPGTPLGGISGGPVLAVKDLSYPLIGLISEFSHDYELLYLKTLSHLPAAF